MSHLWMTGARFINALGEKRKLEVDMRTNNVNSTVIAI